MSQVKRKIKDGVLSFPVAYIIGFSLHQRLREVPAFGPGDVLLSVAALDKQGSSVRQDIHDTGTELYSSQQNDG